MEDPRHGGRILRSPPDEGNRTASAPRPHVHHRIACRPTMSAGSPTQGDRGRRWGCGAGTEPGRRREHLSSKGSKFGESSFGGSDSPPSLRGGSMRLLFEGGFRPPPTAFSASSLDREDSGPGRLPFRHPLGRWSYMPAGSMWGSPPLLAEIASSGRSQPVYLYGLQTTPPRGQLAKRRSAATLVSYLTLRWDRRVVPWAGRTPWLLTGNQQTGSPVLPKLVNSSGAIHGKEVEGWTCSPRGRYGRGRSRGRPGWTELTGRSSMEIGVCPHPHTACNSPGGAPPVEARHRPVAGHEPGGDAATWESPRLRRPSGFRNVGDGDARRNAALLGAGAAPVVAALVEAGGTGRDARP